MNNNQNVGQDQPKQVRTSVKVSNNPGGKSNFEFGNDEEPKVVNNNFTYVMKKK